MDSYLLSIDFYVFLYVMMQTNNKNKNICSTMLLFSKKKMQSHDVVTCTEYPRPRLALRSQRMKILVLFIPPAFPL